MANLYRSLIRLRACDPVLQTGNFEAAGRFGEVLAFRRRLGERALTVLLSFSSAVQDVRAASPGNSCCPRLSIVPETGLGRSSVCGQTRGLIVETPQSG